MTVTAGAGEPERLRVGRVTPGLLRVLRADPKEGRIFTEQDVVPGDGPGPAVPQLPNSPIPQFRNSAIPKSL
jgi:hypothetical protein